MVAGPSQPPPDEDAEQRLLLLGYTWEQYEGLLEIFEERPGVHLTYLRGDLEIMTTSMAHERARKVITRLLHGYAEEVGLDLNAEGRPTLRDDAEQHGIDPDDCYVIGRKSVPDFAIEIVYAPWKVDKRAVYAALGVREVWVYRDGALTVHVLDGDRWRTRAKSRVIPDLDLALLQRFVRFDEGQTKLVSQYVAALRDSATGGR